MEKQQPIIAKTVLYNKRTSGGIFILNLKIYYRAIVIKTVLYWHRNIVNQWNQIKNPEKNPHTYGYLIFDRGIKTIQWSR